MITTLTHTQPHPFSFSLIQRGLRLLALCLIMFIIAVYASIVDSKAQGRLGLLNIYKSVFDFDGMGEFVFNFCPRALFQVDLFVVVSMYV